MKVGGVKSSKTSRAGAKGSSRRKSGDTVTTVSPFGGALETDRVEVGDSDTIDLIKDLVASSPDIRADEVDRVVRELRGGKYKINFEKVADGFLKEVILTEISKRNWKKS